MQSGDWREIPLDRLNAICCQLEYEESSIADETEVCGGSDCNAAVKEGRVFDGVAIKALSPKF